MLSECYYFCPLFEKCLMRETDQNQGGEPMCLRPQPGTRGSRSTHHNAEALPLPREGESLLTNSVSGGSFPLSL